MVTLGIDSRGPLGDRLTLAGLQVEYELLVQYDLHGYANGYANDYGYGLDDGPSAFYY